MDVNQLCHFALSELDDNVMPFWLSYVKDCGSERMIGTVDFFGEPDDKASISVILLCRVLWSLCAYYRKGGTRKTPGADGNSKNEKSTTIIDTAPYLKAAKNVHHFLLEYCVDSTTGFFYEQVKLNKKSNEKHNEKLRSIALGQEKRFIPCSESCFKTLTQSYAIYALAEFFGATSVQKDLDQVLTLVGRLESATRRGTHSFYSSAILIENEMCDDQLSNIEETQFNSNHIDTRCQMHLVEAYTCLLRVHFDKHVHFLLMNLLKSFTTCIYRYAQDYFPLSINQSGQTLSLIHI